MTATATPQTHIRFATGIPPRTQGWTLLACALLALLWPLTASAQSAVFGPRTFVRSTGTPITEVATFAATPGEHVFRAESDGLASAVVTLNGAEIFRPSDFDGGRRTLERRVTLLASNRLTVELRSRPGSWLRILVPSNGPTEPLIRATVTPAANAAGWHNTDATVTFTCTAAPGPGASECPSPVVVSAEGAGQTVTGMVRDGNGTVHQVTVTVNIDKTAPTLAPTLSPAANANGWHRDTATATFTCSDALSGVIACTEPRTFSAEGVHEAAGEARDRAGNVATVATPVRIDRTAPVIAAQVAPAANAAGWHNTPATVTFTCTDAGSGIHACSPATVVSNDGADQVVAGTATDLAGNTASASATVNLDTTGPQIVPHFAALPNEHGWYTADVPVTFTCQDAQSGVEQCAAPLTVTREGSEPLPVTVRDRAGNTTTLPLTVKLDKSAPAITATAEPAANAAGWHRMPATVTFACTDAVSSIANCTAPVTVTEDTNGQEITGTVTDLAGHTATASLTVKLDTIAPAIQAIVSSEGPTAGDVTVTFACLDSGSGVEACPPARVLTTEGAGQVVTGTVTDRAGNSATASVTVTIDRSRPTIIASLDRGANAAGWHNAPVTVTFTCEDPGGNVLSCPAPVVVSTDGANQIVTGTVTDQAGNTATTSITVNLDTTAPAISAAAPAGWSRTPATVTFACEDALSGVAQCQEPVVVSGDGTHAVVGAVSDRAGNVAQATAQVRIDTVAPTISASAERAPNAAGWYNAPVTVSFTCADEGSGVSACAPPITVSTEGTATPVTGTVTDAAGNTASVSLPINLDTTPPVVRVTGVPAWSRTDVTAMFVCEDAGSGIVSCPDARTVTQAGSTVVEGVATDAAGNSTKATATVRIDRDAPVISAAVTPAANEFGWHRRPATVSFTCSDAGSSVVECPAPVTLDQDGAGQVVTRTIADQAGNTATASVTLNIDRTAPTLLPIPSKTGAWVREAVTVTFQCVDALSGVVECPAPVVVAQDGATQVVSGTIADRAGNTTSNSVSVSIDRTAPMIMPVLGTEPNAQGWHNRAVEVSFTCTDAASGVQECAPPQTVSTEGASQSVIAFATDVAGNASSAQATLRIDRTAPVITIASPQANAIVRAPQVTITGSVTDALAGVATVTCGTAPATLTNGAFTCVVALGVGPNAIEIRATDQAGNTGVGSTTVRFDQNTAPVANPGGPYEGAAQQPILFDGSRSTDPENQPLTYAWLFSDGGRATGARPSYTFKQPGAFTAALTVTDSAGATHVATATVTIAAANRTPAVTAGGPYSGDVAVPIAFSSTASDPDNDALTYSWTFGDGTTATGAAPRKAYSTPGTFTAKVVVSDGRGGQVEATAAVTVRAANQRPVARVGGPYTGQVQSPITFSGGASSDPDNDTLSYAWSFGDGATGSGASAAHAYASTGTFTVTLTVNDGRGGSHAASTQVTVGGANGNPIARAGGPYSGEIGVPVAFDGSESSDPDGDALTYAWSFGEGGSRTGPIPAYVFAQAGTFTVTLTVNDGRGGTATATVPVSIMAPAPGENRNPVARLVAPTSTEAGIAVILDGSSSSDPDNDALSYAWQFGDDQQGSGVSASHAWTTPGTYTVTLTVTDARGATHMAAQQIVVAAQPDRAPPVMSLLAPSSVLPGATVTLLAAVTDNRGVTSVTFTAPGAEPVTVATPPFEFSLQIPSVAAAGTTVDVQAIAHDAAGNAASASHTFRVVTSEDEGAPAVSLQAPSATAAGATIRFTASATDAGGVKAVRFFVDGTAAGVDTSAPYETTFAVPANATAGASLSVIAEAEDFSGNRGRASKAVLVDGTSDTQPPTVTLNAPPETTPGALLVVTADPGGANDTALITFRIDGAVVHSTAAEPYEVRYPVPSALPNGTRLNVSVEITDFAGLTGTASAQVLVTAEDNGRGLLTGEVYDDARGLPLPGVTVTLSGTDASGQLYDAQVTTDARGRYTLRAAAGLGRLEFTKAQWTSAVRHVTIQAGAAVEALDARLTPRAAATAVGSVLGGKLVAGPVTLEVPAGALTASGALAMTRLSSQGLAGVLPGGWAPITAVDIAPAVTFGVQATLRAGGISNGTSIALVRWDTVAAAWRVVTTGVAGAAGLDFTIDRSGQYAFVRADVLPQAPPAAVAGDLLAGVQPEALPAAAAAVVSPQPKVVFYEPGVKSDVAGRLTAGTALLTSGTRVWARIGESYTFVSGDRLQPEPYVQDLFFYQDDDAEALVAAHVVTPSFEFEALALESGVIGIDLQVPPAAAPGPSLIGADGGAATSATGERLEVPAGATSNAVAVQVARLESGEVGLTLPEGFAFVGGAHVSISGGSLSRTASFSIARPAGLADDARVLLFRVADVQGRSALAFVGLGAVGAERIASSAVLPRSGAPLEGVRASGRFVFLRATASVGYVAGTVLGPTGQPAAGAVVEADTLPQIVGVSRGVEGYATVARTGAAVLTGHDPATSDGAVAPVTIAATGTEIGLDLRLGPQPPRVVAVTPAHNAQHVPLTGAMVVTFSEPVAPASVSGAAVQRLVLAKADGTIVPGIISLGSGNTVATFRPVEPLAQDTVYTFQIQKEIADRSGLTLPAALAVEFRTLDATPPVVGGEIKITASIPGADEKTTVSGSAGAVGATDVVTVENVTTGLQTPVIGSARRPDGSFAVLVPATRADRLQVRIVDASGNATVVAIARFTQVNQDGSVSSWVGREGGLVNGPDGVAAEVPNGAFPEGTIVTLKSVSEAQFPVALEPKHREHFSYSGGVSVDFGGQTPRQYVNVGIAKPEGVSARDQWMVVQAAINQAGQSFMQSVDTARVIGNLVRTASPPCPGVTGNGTFGFLKAARPLGVLYGSAFTATELPPGIFVPFLVPMPGVLTLPDSINPFAQMDSLEPFVAHATALAEAFPRPVCQPMLSGRVSITKFRTQVKLPSDLEGDAVEIVLTNRQRGTETRLYPPFASVVSVEGANQDTWAGTILRADGSSRSFPVEIVQRKYVRVAIPAAQLQPADTEVVVENVTKKTRWASGLHSELRPRFDFAAILEGEVGDTIRVLASQGTGATATQRDLTFSRFDYPVGNGNLLVKAVPGAFDPTLAEIEQANTGFPADQQIPLLGVASITLHEWVVNADRTGQEVRTTRLFDRRTGIGRLDTGALIAAVEGEFTNVFKVVIAYEEPNGNMPKVIQETLPNFRIQVRDPASGALRTETRGQVPPRDEPLAIDTGALGEEGELETDPNAFVNIDPRTPITLTFSEPLDPATVAQFLRLLDSRGLVVAGEWVLSNGNKTITFVPAGGIGLDQTYRIMLGGVRTGLGQRLRTTSVQVRTFQPRRLATLPVEDGAANSRAVAVGDLALLKQQTETGAARHVIVAGTENREGYKLHTVDVTQPTAPSLLGRAAGGFFLRRMTVMQDVAIPIRDPLETPFPECNGSYEPIPGGRQQFRGDLIVTAQSNVDSAFINLFDVTNPVAPCIAGAKPVIVNPAQDQNIYLRRGTFRGIPFARGIGTIEHLGGAAAVLANAEFGLAAIDMQDNLPEVFPDKRVEEGLTPGDYHDVLGVEDRLFAYNANYNSAPSIDVLDANLAPVAQVPLDDPGAMGAQIAGGRMAVARRVPVDRNGDGQIGENELFDLLYVGGISRITVIDITDRDAPRVLTDITTPLRTTDLTVAADGRTLYQAGRAQDTQAESVLVVDVSNPFATAATDQNNDGRDDRIVFELPYTGEQKQIGGIEVDIERGLLFVGTGPYGAAQPATPFGVEIWAVAKHALASVNRPPVANAGDDKEGVVNQVVTLDGTRSSDPDLDPLRYQWTQVSGPAAVLSNGSSAQPSFTPTDAMAGATLTFQLIVEDGLASSAPDQVAVTVRDEQLVLKPVLVVVPVVGGTRQLKVELVPAGGGTPVDVTVSGPAPAPPTLYQWIGNGLVPGDALVPDIDQIINDLNARVFNVPDGQDPPFKLIPPDKLEVANGQLIAREAGVQVLRATRGGATSNFSIVIAGIELESIDIEPETTLNTLAGLLSSSMKKNAPMILSASDTASFITNKGYVSLVDVTFKVAGGASISVASIKDALFAVIERPLAIAMAPLGPAAPKAAEAMLTLMTGAIEYAGTQFLEPIEIKDPRIASVQNQRPLRGWVTGLQSGVTLLTGTLKIEGLGEASDSMFVWVTPKFLTANVVPHVTHMSLQEPADRTPGPTVRTFVTMDLGTALDPGIPIPARYQSATKFLDKVLPGGIANWLDYRTSTPFELELAGLNLRFTFDGHITVTADKVQIRKAEVGFFAPNAITEYEIGDSTIAELGDTQGLFDRHVRRKDKEGWSPLYSTVKVPFFDIFGEAKDTSAKIIVSGGPYVTKQLKGAPMKIRAGQTLTFTITVYNPTDAPLANVVLTDEFTMGARLINRRTIAVGTIEAKGRRIITTTEHVPEDGEGELKNRVWGIEWGLDFTWTSRIEALHLTPYLIPMIKEGGTRQLQVDLLSTAAPTTEVTTDPDTKYESISENGPDDLRAIGEQVWALLHQFANVSPVPPMAVANVTIGSDGVLTATSKGINIIRATHDGLESNPAVVLVGVQLKEIDLEPESLFTKAAGLFMKNPPLIVTKDGNGLPLENGFLSNHGAVLLTDARFKVFDSGVTISVADLAKALKPALDGAITAALGGNAPTARVLSWAFSKLIARAAQVTATQFLNPFDSKDSGTIAKAGPDPELFKGLFKGVQSGTTVIEGTLDLKAFGKASDSVYGIVLPDLDSVEIDDRETWRHVDDGDPQPDGNHSDALIRTFAKVLLAAKIHEIEVLETEVPVPTEAEYIRAAIAKVVPKIEAVLDGKIRIDEEFEFFDRFRFALDTDFRVTCTITNLQKAVCNLNVEGVKVGFHVPVTMEPFIKVTYTAEKPELFTMKRDAHTTSIFDTEMLHQRIAGISNLKSHVDMSAVALGTAEDPHGRVVIVDDPVDGLFKFVRDGRLSAAPGDALIYRVGKTNPTNEVWEDVVLRDTLYLNGVQISQRLIPLGRLAPGETKSEDVVVIAPEGKGELRNVAECVDRTCEPVQVRLPLNPWPVINEVVNQPQQDWNGDGQVDTGDQWVEFWTNSGKEELRSFTLEYTGADGQPVVFEIDPDASQIEEIPTEQRRRLVLTGFPAMAANTQVVLRAFLPNGVGPIADELAITDRATSPADEAVARVPEIFDRNQPDDFRRQPATRGARNQ